MDSRRLFRLIISGLCIPLLLGACAAPAGATLTPITIHASSAAYPWLSGAYDCAPPSSAVVLSDSPDVDLALQLGEPRELQGSAFQVGNDDLLVVTHPEVAVGELSLRDVEAVFAGQLDNWSDVGGADQAVEVWAYPSGVDVQAFFDQYVLHGRPVSSLARIAVSAQHMSDSVGAVAGSIGLLPRRWKAGNTREVLTVATLPVLALAESSPQGVVAEMLACMQAPP